MHLEGGLFPFFFVDTDMENSSASKMLSGDHALDSIAMLHDTANKIKDPFSSELLWRVATGEHGDSQYAKNLARAIFGDKVLMESSITGIPCRTKKGAVPKKKLDPKKLDYLQDIFKLRIKKEFTGRNPKKLDAAIEKRANRRQIEDYVREKIQTLLRPSRNLS